MADYAACKHCSCEEGECVIAEMVAEAVAVERERCAGVAASFASQGDWNKDTAECIAASIREPLDLAVEP